VTQPMNNGVPYKIGLTGNITTGKSTVAKMLEELGAAALDADKVAHRVMAPGAPAYAAVVAAFGPDIVAENGEIDRRALGEIVFSDPEALARLESLVHPAVIAEVDRWIATREVPVVVVEAIKLLESGMAETYDAIWVTACSEATQVVRLMDARGMTRADARQRIHAQPPQADKIARADVVIDTEATLAETRCRVAAAWANIPLHR
jgi:dephospho-CoA kinase